MAELISNEPLRDESRATESELSALQAVEAEAKVREAVSARTDAGSEPALDSSSGWLRRIGGGAMQGAERLCTISHATGRGGV